MKDLKFPLNIIKYITTNFEELFVYWIKSVKKRIDMYSEEINLELLLEIIIEEFWSPLNCYGSDDIITDEEYDLIVDTFDKNAVSISKFFVKMMSKNESDTIIIPKEVLNNLFADEY